MSHSNRFTASNSNISSNNNNNNQSSSEQELYLAKLKQTHKANGSRVSLASQHSPASSLASSVASNSSLAPESQKMHQHSRHQHNQHQHHHHSALHLSPAEAQRLSPAALAGQQALSGKPAPLSSKSAGNLIAPGGPSPPLAAKVGRVQLLQHQQQHQQVDRSDSASLPSSTSTSESMFKRRLG